MNSESNEVDTDDRLEELLDETRRVLENHEYKIYYREPECIVRKEHPDGKPYYEIHVDDLGYQYGSGSITVYFDLFGKEISFLNNLVEGWAPPEYETDSESDLELLDEEYLDFFDLLDEYIDIPSDGYDIDDTIKLYELATGEKIEEYKIISEDDEDEE